MKVRAIPEECPFRIPWRLVADATTQNSVKAFLLDESHLISTRFGRLNTHMVDSVRRSWNLEPKAAVSDEVGRRRQSNGILAEPDISYAMDPIWVYQVAQV